MTDRDGPIGGVGDEGKGLILRPLALPDAPGIDGLKLLDIDGRILLLFSTQGRQDSGWYEMLVRAVPVTDPVRVTKVATIERLLPVPPAWDARLTESGEIELVFERAGGATNALERRSATGTRLNVSAAHLFESFGQPRFVRVPPGTHSAQVSAVADQKTVVVFPEAVGGQAPPYEVLAKGDDGLVGGTTARWVVLKTSISGPVHFNVAPGHLQLVEVSSERRHPSSSVPFPGIVIYEFDAAALGTEVAVFATSTPAVLLLGSRPGAPRRFEAPDPGWLSALSRPTVAVGTTHLHFAALVNPGTPEAVVLYGATPLSALKDP